MGKKRISPTDLSNDSKRVRIATPELPEFLLNAFEQTQNFNVRKRILVQVIEAGNLELFTQILDSFKKMAKSLRGFLNLVGSPSNNSPIAAAIINQRWDFLEALRNSILEMGTYSTGSRHKAVQQEHTSSNIAGYFLYVAIHEQIPIAIIRNLKTHFNIDTTQKIKFNGFTYDCLDYVLGFVDSTGVMPNTTYFEYFYFLWHQLTPSKKEIKLDYFFRTSRSVLFLINQEITLPNSFSYAKQLAFLAIGRKYEAFYDFLAKIIANDPQAFPHQCNLFEFINILELPPDQLKIIICNYSQLLTDNKFTFSFPADRIYNHQIENVLNIVNLFNIFTIKNQSLKIDYALVAVYLSQSAISGLANKLIPLLSNTEILTLFNYLINPLNTNKYTGGHLQTLVRQTLLIRPSIQDEFWDFLQKLFFTDKKIETYSFNILKWFNLGAISLKEKQFIKQLVEANKNTFDSLGLGLFRHIIYYLQEDIRYSNLVNSLLMQASQQSTLTVEEEIEKVIVPPPLSPEEQQLIIWKNKLKIRYGEPLQGTLGFLSIFANRVLRSLFKHFDAECSKQEIPIFPTFQKFIQNEFSNLINAESIIEFHQGKVYWEDPNFAVVRLIKSLDKEWSTHIPLLDCAISDSRFSKEEKEKFYDEIKEIAHTYTQKNITHNPITFITQLYHLLANVHPDIQIAKENDLSLPNNSSVTTSSISFFSQNKLASSLKEKVNSLITSWEDRKTASLSRLSSDSLTRYVQTYGLHPINVQGEYGNCFFDAVLHQMDSESGIMRGSTSPAVLKARVAEYRAKAINYILEHPKKYENAVPGGLDNFIIENHYQSNTWADHVIIDALANTLKVNLVILKNTGDKTVFKVEEATKTLFLGYEQDLHYTSLLFDPILGVAYDPEAWLNEERMENTSSGSMTNP